jgi:hypothetical protein
MTIKQKIEEMTSIVNWNYIGIAAGVLSIVVAMYNVSRYYEEIRKVERQ